MCTNIAHTICVSLLELPIMNNVFKCSVMRVQKITRSCDSQSKVIAVGATVEAKANESTTINSSKKRSPGEQTPNVFA